MPTKPQLARLFALARNAGMDGGELHEVIESRFKLKSVKDLRSDQYEDLTRSLSQRRVRERTVVALPDISPLSGSLLTHPSHGHQVAQAAFNDGDFFPEATEEDIGLAGKLLDCFRTYRKRGRITVAQALAIVSLWKGYHLGVWREAARRYLDQASTKDERYFLGILRRVARDSAADGSAVATTLPLEGPRAPHDLGACAQHPAHAVGAVTDRDAVDVPPLSRASSAKERGPGGDAAFRPPARIRRTHSIPTGL